MPDCVSCQSNRQAASAQFRSPVVCLAACFQLNMFAKHAEPLSAFRCGVLLAVARIPRHEAPVLDLLRKRVNRFFKFLVSARWSMWLQRHNSLAPSPVDSQDLSVILQRLVAHSAAGWDIVVPALVQLGVSLIEGTPAKDVVIPASMWAGEPLSAMQFVEAPPPPVFVAAVGTRLLRDTFHRHKAARPAVIEQILSRVGMLDARMHVFLSLLSVLCRTWPHLVLDHSSKLKVILCLFCFVHALAHAAAALQESLEYLHHLSPESAHFFLTAITPVLQQRRELRDSLMLVLRKALFQRALETRIVAVDGFASVLHLLAAVSGAGGHGLGQVKQRTQCTRGVPCHSIPFVYCRSCLRWVTRCWV